MAVTLKIRRRASTGSAGAPSALKAGELAYSEVAATNTLFYGYGDDGSGNATSIISIAGPGAYATLTSAQIISGDKTFTGTCDFTGATVNGLATNSDQLTEGSTNLFLTDARVRAALSATTASGVTFTSGTGVIALASIPNSSLANQGVTFTNGSTAFANNLGQTVTVQGTANEVEVGSDSASRTLTVGLPDDVTIGNDLTVTGDLVVNGTTTTVNSTTVTVDDKNIELGSVASPTNSTADGGGLTLKGDSDYSITWVNATSSWTFNQNINVTTGGLSIGGTQVLTSARQLKNTAITGTGNTIDNIVLDGGVF
jgi:uncharacterized Zn ribbon protein